MLRMAEEIYVSTDVEADGPIPGPHSMLSFGSAAFRRGGEMVGTFAVNLELRPGAAPDPRTHEGWLSQPEAWQACRENCEEPAAAIRRHADWVRALPGYTRFF